MKKILLVLVIVPMVFACHNKKAEEALKSRGDSIQQVAMQKDTAILTYIQSFNEIQDRLDSIKQKEFIINEKTKGNVELKQDAKENIKNDIEQIYQLILKNKNTIAGLRKKLKESNAKTAELEKMIEHLNKSIEEKDAEINTLKDQVSKLHIDVSNLSSKVENLTAESESKTKVIDEQTIALNTAYFTLGTKKELRDNKVLSDKGGFIGIGKGKTLLPDFNKSYFTKVDIRTFKGLPLMKKKIKLLTSHPSSAYKIKMVKNVPDSLVITNYNDFWSASKYLIILVE